MKNPRPGIMVTVHGPNLKKGIFFLILVFVFTFSITGIMTTLKPEYRISSSSINDFAKNFTGESLVYILGYENHYFTQSLPKDSVGPNYGSVFFELLTSINLDDPRSLLGRELPGFSLYDTEIVVAGDGTNYTNIPFESAPPLEVMLAEREAALQNLEEVEKPREDKPKVIPPNMTTGDKKVVYIYHTHSRESYLPNLKGVTNPDLAYHSKVNVTKVGERLAEDLNDMGIGTVVNTDDLQGMLTKKGMSFSQAYDFSRPIVQSAMANNRDLKYFIDIHRDSSRRKLTTVTINGKPYAKVSFIIGGDNENYQKNLQLAKELHELLEKKYPGLSRGIMKKQGSLTNGKFNQDLSSNAILIEFGGVDNSFEELYRTADAIAEVFSDYYWQAEKVNGQQNPQKQ